jgi:predicted nuclease of restriction endonuclease-like (RecB) superfamily
MNRRIPALKSSQPKDAIPESRLSRGRRHDDAHFPAVPAHAGLPSDYGTLLADLKQRIATERLRVVLASNAALVRLYADIGQAILQRQSAEGWGAKTIDRLAVDLKAAFPEMTGFSPRNLVYMRTFAAAWPQREFTHAPLAQLSWYHHQALLDKLTSRDERLWYAAQAAQHGWSRNILALQIAAKAKSRSGKAQSNFAATLPPTDSDLAVQVFKDPYLFDFLGTAVPRREAELEQGLIDHIQHFLLELGQGFAFVGRQVHLEFASEDHRLDLLFYHLRLRCYVVIELKATGFEPGHAAQLNMYMAAVDDLLRHADDKPTIGLLLVKDKNRVLVEYALNGYRAPIGVAAWQTQLTQNLPDDLRPSLPTVEEIEAELSAPGSVADPVSKPSKKPKASKPAKPAKSITSPSPRLRTKKP